MRSGFPRSARGRSHFIKNRTLPESFLHLLRGDPLWVDQLASLDREVLRRNAGQVDDFADRIVSEDAACPTVSTLLQRHHIQSPDLLLIDTEGWDWRILRQFDLARLQPKLTCAPSTK
jgi:hypothetical protein